MAIIVDSYSESNSDADYSLYSAGNTKFGQSFTGNGGLLSDCKFYLKKQTGLTGNATVSIYAHSGTFGTSSVGTGTALAISDVVDVSTLETTSQLVTFSFSGVNKIFLEDGIYYVAVVEFDGGSISVRLIIGVDTTSPTHSGNTCSYSGSWSASADFDTCFYVYTDGAYQNSPGTIVDDASFGSITWNNPDNAKVEDGTTAIAYSSGDDYTHILKATNFGFSIPAEATIDGIVVSIKKKADSTIAQDAVTRIVKNNVIADESGDRSNPGNWPSTLTYIDYGSSSDLWGETWTVDDINSSGFGIAAGCVYSYNGESNLQIDHIRITVYYTEGETPSTSIKDIIGNGFIPSPR